MTQSTQKQLRFHPSNSKTIRADFNGGELSSDFGALLLRETILHSGLIPIRILKYELEYMYSLLLGRFYHNLKNEMV